MLECLETDLLDSDANINAMQSQYGKVLTGTQAPLFDKKNAPMSKSQVKLMLIVFFDTQGMVHKKLCLLDKEEMVNFTKKCSNISESLIVREALAKQNMATLPQPPYSPDLAPPDFFLVSHIKRRVKGHCIRMTEEVQAALPEQLCGYRLPYEQ